MDPTALIRTTALMLPACWTVIAVMYLRPTRRLSAGLLLAFLWNVPTLVAVNWVAQRLGWWRFQAEGGLLLGLPVDLLIGWALLWGPLAGLAASRLPWGGVAVAMVAMDLLLMPACAPVVQLGPNWLIGEAIAVVLCLMPALLFARWTERRERLAWRAILQMLTYAGLFLFLIPAIALQMADATLPQWSQWDLIWIQVMLIFALPGVSALQEFVQRGGGTPFPYDPPRRLVITGPYMYVRNPMQLTTVLLFMGLAVLLESVAMVAAAIITYAYSAGLAWWHEDLEMEPRWGNSWQLYRRNVRNWLPSWKPWRRQPAQLYIAASCEICQTVRTWILKRKPVALEIVPAEQHPTRDLFRITYNDGNHEEEGMAAIGRALEHLNAGWALVGFFFRLPVITNLLQIICDEIVAAPRRVARTKQC